jgi:hypothetical protein
MLLMPTEMARKRDAFLAMGMELTQKQIAVEKPSAYQKHDFFSYMMSTENSEKSMTYGEMVTNATVFMIAGSESTATLLAGTILSLLKNPAKMDKVTKEIRDAFETEDQITTVSSSKLLYMLACLEESLRMTLPATFGVARKTVTPTMIAGLLDSMLLGTRATNSHVLMSIFLSAGVQGKTRMVNSRTTTGLASSHLVRGREIALARSGYLFDMQKICEIC